MLAEYLACLIFAYGILCQVFAMIRGHDDPPPPWAVVLLTANLGLGSTLFFLGSRAFVYHEALLCGMCFALASSYYTLRTLSAPERRWWIAALICGTLSLHARPPAGIFALAFLGAAALVVFLQQVFGQLSPDHQTHRRLKSLAIGLLCIVGLLSFNGLSYLKFKSFSGMPLEYNMQYDADRLAKVDGKAFHWSNLPLNAQAYFLRPMWLFRPTFPYLYAQGHPPTHFPKARIDQAEPLLGLPFAMPGLFWLAAAGMIGVFLWQRALRPAWLALGFAVLPTAVALFAAFATSQRYTADFCPFLVCAASGGLVMVESLPRFLRRLACALAGALTGAAILITLALTLHYQGELVWDVPEHVSQDYHALRMRVDRLFGIEHPDPE